MNGFRKVLPRTNLLVFLALITGFSSSLNAVESYMLAERSQTQTGMVARVEKVFEESRRRFITETNSTDAPWEFSRACFDLASVKAVAAERARIAELGIAAARQLIARTSSVAAAHYYLGMNIGIVADTKRNLAALRMVNDIEHEFLTAARLDPRFDFGGPDRNLGLLYLEAPAVISVGNRGKALRHLRRAVEFAPDYPENRLRLIEAWLKWGERGEAARELRALQKIWPTAQKEWAGPEWGGSWKDWERRAAEAKSKVIEGSRQIESPRGAP